MSHNVDLSINNPRLSALASRRYDSKYTDVPNRVLKGELKAQIETIYHAITGESLPADEHTLTVRANKGTLDALYSPSLYLHPDENHLVIKWGPRDIIVDIVSKCMVFVDEEGNAIGAGADLVTVNFADVPFGNSRDLVLRVTYYDESTEEMYSIDFGTWTSLKDGEGLPTADELNQFVKRAKKKVFPCFEQAPQQVRFDGETYGLVDLTPGTYKVIGYRPVNIPDRVYQQFMVVCAPNPALGQPEPFQVWGHGTINPTLESGPVITEEQPAELVLHAVNIKKGKDGKERKRPVAGLLVAESALADSDDISLDF